MSEPTMLDKTFQIIMKRMVDTGLAPHYTEIASELGLSMEEGRKAVHDLFAAGIPGWLFPRYKFDYLLCAVQQPAHSVQNTVDGQQKWFGQ